MWTHIYKNNKIKYDTDPRWHDPIKDPQGAFKRSFKYFFEEKIWKLAMVLYDDKAFDLVNFNSIVKSTLICKMKRLDEEKDHEKAVH